MLASLSSTTLIGKDTDILVLLLHHTHLSDIKDIYFRSDRGKGLVFYMITMKEMEICDRLLYYILLMALTLHERYWHRKYISRLKIVHGDHSICTRADTLSVPNQNHIVIDSSGKKQWSLFIIDEIYVYTSTIKSPSAVQNRRSVKNEMFSSV